MFLITVYLFLNHVIYCIDSHGIRSHCIVLYLIVSYHIILNLSICNNTVLYYFVLYHKVSLHHTVMYSLYHNLDLILFWHILSYCITSHLILYFFCITSYIMYHRTYDIMSCQVSFIILCFVSYLQPIISSHIVFYVVQYYTSVLLCDVISGFMSCHVLISHVM